MNIDERADVKMFPQCFAETNDIEFQSVVCQNLKLHGCGFIVVTSNESQSLDSPAANWP